MANGLGESDWKVLLKRIASGKCTPFLGPGVTAGLLPSRTAIAQSWAHEYDYPLADTHDFARVAQYLAVQYDPFYPKEELQAQFINTQPVDFAAPNQSLGVLADLDLPIYITTNYDDLMFQALLSRKKEPRRELCRWNSDLRRRHPSLLDAGFEPTPATPLVFHLNGHYQWPESLVLTEDDYLDFLVNISTSEYQLPHRIQRAMTGASLLIIGYDPSDWDFRVLFRGLITASEASLRGISVTVQLPPVPADIETAARQKVQTYLSKYFEKTDMRCYWGSVQMFIEELQQRWQGLQPSAASVTADGKHRSQVDLLRLLQNLTDAFNKDELQTLAFELRVDYENLPEAKDSFARELIVYLQRRKRLHELVDSCRRLRPNTAW